MTLIEIIVATVILALTLAGMANLFISGKRWVLISQTRMVGGELGKFFLDPLQMLVRQDTWNVNCLGTGNAGGCVPALPVAIALDRNYNVAYSIVQPIPNVNRVIATITWNVEP